MSLLEATGNKAMLDAAAGKDAARRFVMRYLEIMAADRQSSEMPELTFTLKLENDDQ